VGLTPPDRNAALILQQLTGQEFQHFDWVNCDFHPILDPPLLL
jgi:hypothetical protein